MNYGFIIFIELIDTQMVMSYRYPPKKTTAQRCTGPSAEDCHDGNHERGVAPFAAGRRQEVRQIESWAKMGQVRRKKMGGLNHELRDLMGFHGIYSGFWLVFWGFGWGFHHRNHESN
jgi:hypothetical protein